MTTPVAVAVPPALSRNPALAAFDYGLATAALKNIVLRDLIMQIDGNSDELKDLTTALSTWKVSDWAALSIEDRLERSEVLDLTEEAYPQNKAYVPAPKDVDTGVIGSPLYATYPPTPGSISFADMRAIFRAGTDDITEYPVGTSFALTDGTFVRTGEDSFVEIVDPSKDWQPFMDRAPTQEEFDEFKQDIEEAAQKRTQIGATQQAFAQQVVGEKSNAELFSTVALQRWESIMRDIASKIG